MGTTTGITTTWAPNHNDKKTGKIKPRNNQGEQKKKRKEKRHLLWPCLISWAPIHDGCTLSVLSVLDVSLSVHIIHSSYCHTREKSKRAEAARKKGRGAKRTRNETRRNAPSSSSSSFSFFLLHQCVSTFLLPSSFLLSPCISVGVSLPTSLDWTLIECIAASFRVLSCQDCSFLEERKEKKRKVKTNTQFGYYHLVWRCRPGANEWGASTCLCSTCPWQPKWKGKARMNRIKGCTNEGECSLAGRQRGRVRREQT